MTAAAPPAAHAAEPSCGCDKGCEPSCCAAAAAEPSCCAAPACEPACAAAPSCGAAPACGSCCAKKHCCHKGLLSGLLAHHHCCKKSCCKSSCGCGAAPSCGCAARPVSRPVPPPRLASRPVPLLPLAMPLPAVAVRGSQLRWLQEEVLPQGPAELAVRRSPLLQEELLCGSLVRLWRCPQLRLCRRCPGLRLRLRFVGSGRLGRSGRCPDAAGSNCRSLGFDSEPPSGCDRQQGRSPRLSSSGFESEDQVCPEGNFRADFFIESTRGSEPQSPRNEEARIAEPQIPQVSRGRGKTDDEEDHSELALCSAER